MKKISTFLFLLAITASFAQYTTPDTGVDWTLDDLATASPGTVTVSGSVYTLLEDITIAESDILRIDSDLTLEIEADVLITVFGEFNVTADNVLITAVDNGFPYEGFRFEEFSVINIQNATIEYGGGLRVLTETFTLDNATLQSNVGGVSTGAVVSMSRGIPVITNNTFLFNETPALSSGANNQVSAIISGNYIEGNSQANQNRPQINMGATRVNDTLKILNNTIIGDVAMDQVGGIAVANLVGGTLRAIIEGNTITNNRYGITLIGNNTYGLLKNNIIEDNNTQGNPNLGGSGINLNAPAGGMIVDITENEIRRNLWGITIQGEVDVNLGDDLENPGMNVFSENGNGGVTYALFNNGPNTISAKHNCWVEEGDGTLVEAEDVIVHQVDDPTYGEVIFDPIYCDVLSAQDPDLVAFSMFPNPTNNSVSFQNQNDFEAVTFYNVNGQNVLTQNVSSGMNIINFNIPSGVYFVVFDGQKLQTVKKLVVK